MRITAIRLRRINAGIDFNQALKVLGISNSMLYKIEIGNRKPSTKVIEKMSRLYDCSIDDLFKDLKSIKNKNKEVC